MSEGTSMERKKWVAAVLSLAMPGLGQIYNGQVIKGISLLIISLVMFVAGCRWSVLLPGGWLAFGLVAATATTITVYAASVFDAYRSAGSSFQPASYNRWYFYLAVWLLGCVLVSGFAYEYVRTNIVEAYKIPSASMEPVVLRGDRVFADKTAFRRMSPQKGDIVVFVYPDDRSKIFMKRIEGLPGDLVSLGNRPPERVPHGMIYVLGDNRNESVDSRTFGFVPLGDVIGKVRQVYYSSGKEGVRWNRIGLALGG